MQLCSWSNLPIFTGLGHDQCNSVLFWKHRSPECSAIGTLTSSALNLFDFLRCRATLCSPVRLAVYCPAL